jgi:glycosyltransferase involved in cell wall biosynthesis
MRFNLKRKPGIFERGFIRRDDREMEAADIVFSLFPLITDYFKLRYKNKNIHYLGNAVNTMCEPPLDPDNMIAAKQRSGKLLFIGGEKYRKGLETLIGALEILKPDFSHLSVHVIGMSRNDFDRISDNVFFYGYLDKDNAADIEIYYTLLQEAMFYINTTPLWPAFQAPVEALYFYTPIIISPNDEFLKTFGFDLEKCCIFCPENTPALLAKCIRQMLTSINYAEICAASHGLVKNFTWDAVANNFLAIVSNYLNKEEIT